MYEEQTKIVHDYLLHKVNSLNIESYPFSHSYTDDFFPIEFYKKLNKYFPSYTDIGFHEELPHKPKRYIKSIFDLQTEATNGPAIETYNVLANVFDRDLALAFLKKFNIQADNLGWHCDYAWDLPKENTQSLQPHTDNKAKIISMIVYLPLIETPIRIVNKQIQYFKTPGTDLLIQNTDKTFTTVREIKAWCNRAVMFQKGEKSWHSVKETKYPRRTITMFIVDPALCNQGLPYKLI